MHGYVWLTCFLSLHAVLVSSVKYKPVDVVFVMDRTDRACKYSHELGWIGDFGQEFVKQINSNFPDARFGAMSYGDKKATCLSDRFAADRSKKNWCVKFVRELSPLNLNELERILENDQDPFYYQVAVPKKNTNDDRRTDVLSAMMVGAKEPRMGWTDGYDRLNVMVVFGLDYGHVAGDVLCPDPKLTANDGDWNYDCDTEDYPAEEQVVEALREKRMMTVVVNYFTGSDRKLFENLQSKVGFGSKSTSIDKRNVDAVIASIKEVAKI